MQTRRGRALNSPATRLGGDLRLVAAAAAAAESECRATWVYVRVRAHLMCFPVGTRKRAAFIGGGVEERAAAAASALAPGGNRGKKRWCAWNVFACRIFFCHAGLVLYNSSAGIELLGHCGTTEQYGTVTTVATAGTLVRTADCPYMLIEKGR